MQVVASLIRLLSKEAKWVWSDECESCFKEMKEHLTCALMLTHPRMGEPFVIYTDASCEGYGGVLMHNNK